MRRMYIGIGMRTRVWINYQADAAESIDCGNFLNLIAHNIRRRLEIMEERYLMTPNKFFVAEQVNKWRRTFVEGIVKGIGQTIFPETRRDRCQIPTWSECFFICW